MLITEKTNGKIPQKKFSSQNQNTDKNKPVKKTIRVRIVPKAAE